MRALCGKNELSDAPNKPFLRENHDVPHTNGTGSMRRIDLGRLWLHEATRACRNSREVAAPARWPRRWSAAAPHRTNTAASRARWIWDGNAARHARHMDMGELPMDLQQTCSMAEAQSRGRTSGAYSQEARAWVHEHWAQPAYRWCTVMRYMAHIVVPQPAPSCRNQHRCGRACPSKVASTR